MWWSRDIVASLKFGSVKPQTVSTVARLMRDVLPQYTVGHGCLYLLSCAMFYKEMLFKIVFKRGQLNNIISYKTAYILNLYPSLL